MPLRDVEEKHLTITRQDDDRKTNINHTYPYDTLPRLISHLQPKFVIFDAGSKLSTLLKKGFSNPELQKVVHNHPDIDLNAIITLYDAWTRPIPDLALKDESYVDSNTLLLPVRKLYKDGNGLPEVGDGDSDDHHNSEDNNYVGRGMLTGNGDGLLRPRTRSVAAAEQAAPAESGHDHATESGRGDGWSIRPKAAGEKDDGAAKQKVPAVKRRKVFSELPHNQVLSEATLYSIDDYFGVAAWTGDRIHQWSSLTKKRNIMSV